MYLLSHLLPSRVLLLPAFLFFVQSQVLAQRVLSLYTRYDDSFREWYFITDEEEEGTLGLRWLFNDDWTEWDYRIGERFGTIRMKWKDNPESWELRGDGHLVTANTVWPGNFREWRINDGKHTLTLRTRWGNRFDEWELRNSSHGDWSMYTAYEADPRDWIIEDYLDESVPFETRLMLAFIAAFHASPKF